MTGVKGCSGRGNWSLLSKSNKVVSSSLELAQTQAQLTINLVLSNNRKSVHFLEWTSLKDLYGLWASGGHVAIPGPLPLTVFRPKAHVDGCLKSGLPLEVTAW